MEFQEMSKNMESLLTTAVGCGSFVTVNERHKYNQHMRNEYNVTHVNKWITCQYKCLLLRQL